MKKLIALLLAVCFSGVVSLPAFAATSDDAPEEEFATVELVETFDISEKQASLDPELYASVDSLFKGTQDLTTARMTTLWSSNSSKYGSISCYNNGDTDSGQGAVRFIINGKIQDVAAGQGATFRVTSGRRVVISAQALWYDGTYDLEVVAAK